MKTLLNEEVDKLTEDDIKRRFFLLHIDRNSLGKFIIIILENKPYYSICKIGSTNETQITTKSILTDDLKYLLNSCKSIRVDYMNEVRCKPKDISAIIEFEIISEYAIYIAKMLSDKKLYTIEEI